MTPWLSIVGIGEDGLDGLSPAARTLIAEAECLVGGARHFALADGIAPGAERLSWDSPLSKTVAAIAARRGRRVCVLATGDPMHYGIGVTLAREFPDELTVIPGIGAATLACARLGWPLARTAVVTLHGRPRDRLRLHLAPGARLLVLSNDGATPAQVAALLREAGYGDSPMHVLEHMGGPAENRSDGTANAWPAGATADLNVIAIECRAGPGARPRSRLAGLPDDAFLHDGQITKREVRAATLAALAPLPGQRLWDIGAGSGAVAIEWLRSPGTPPAVAVERDAARRDRIARNAAALGVPQLQIVAGAAPAALADLPAPDAVFVGGGVSQQGVVESAWDALPAGGRLVANVVTTQGEQALLHWQARLGGDLTRIAVSRAEPVGPQGDGPLGWKPLMPVTQWAVVKP